MKVWKVLRDEPVTTTKEILSILLHNRKILSKKEIDLFLNPRLEDVTIKAVDIDPQEVKKSISRVQKAIKNNEKIAIFGDYDVDGICSSAILFETIYKSHKRVIPYIPDRFTEGYGLSVKGIDSLLVKDPDVKLIITVDNGIVAFEAAEYAKQKGIDLIITDHHVKSDKVPENFALVHTVKLCGTGIAYLFAQELSKELGVSYNSDTHLDLVALATIADLVPLNGANRTLVKFGLEALRTTSRPGLLSLFNLGKIKKELVGTYEIGHIIGPRLNAAGRLFSAMDSLRLICTKNEQRAQELALALNQANKERQALTEQHSSHAKLAHTASPSSKIVFVHHDEYNEGIIGLVASRLVEQYYLPSFVISRGETVSKGSARSISGVNIIELIRSVPEYILQAGGHPMAAGFSVETAKLDDLKKALEEKAEEVVLDSYLERTLTIDMPIHFEAITYELYQELQKLAPFGMTNYEPVFVSNKVTISDMKPVGSDGKHMKFILSQTSGEKKYTQNCIAFGIGEKARELSKGDTVDVVFTVAEDTWVGNQKLQLKIKDIKLSS